MFVFTLINHPANLLNFINTNENMFKSSNIFQIIARCLLNRRHIFQIIARWLLYRRHIFQIIARWLLYQWHIFQKIARCLLYHWHIFQKIDHCLLHRTPIFWKISHRFPKIECLKKLSGIILAFAKILMSDNSNYRWHKRNKNYQ